MFVCSGDLSVSGTDSDRNVPCALVFNQQSDRDAGDMLRLVHRNLAESKTAIKYAVFCTNVTYKDTSTKPGTRLTPTPPSPLPSPPLLTPRALTPPPRNQRS